MLAKLIFRTNVVTWLALIFSNVALTTVTALYVGLIFVGARTTGEAQEIFLSFGITALSFTVITSFISLTLVTNFTLRLQHPLVAQWQLIGMLPHQASRLLKLQVVAVAALTAVFGAFLALVLWHPFAAFTDSLGLPPAAGLHEGLPLAALYISVGSTTAIGLLTALVGARRAVRADLVEGTSTAGAFRAKKPGVVRFLMCFATAAATCAAYVGLMLVPAPADPGDMLSLLTSYYGTGMLLSITVAVWGRFLISGLLALLRRVSVGVSSTAWFLAVREAAARPALTTSLVIPLVAASSFVGVAGTMVLKMRSVAAASGMDPSEIHSDAGISALFVGGPVVVACVAAAAVLLITLESRRNDIRLLFVAGASQRMITQKLFFESFVYFLLTVSLSYFVIIINDIAVTLAFKHQTIPVITLTRPSWSAIPVVSLGIAIAVVILGGISFGEQLRERKHGYVAASS